MSDLPTPTASRLRAPSWRDSRLLVGVLLVLVSTALGGLVLAHADDTVPVYAAARAWTPGQRLTAEDVAVVRVRLGSGAADYLAADVPLPEARYALRELRAGELVPSSGVGSAQDVGVQQLALQVEATSAGVLARGALVDVYVNRPRQGSAGVGSTRYAGPERVLQRVSVAGVAEADAVLAGAEQTRAVRVMVPSDAVPGLVGDVDAGSRITLVPVPGGPS
ncbi:SAF domain-containing protein [Phycicoccus endophyticus]|uniref:SAF domain-containing protein n=1 Tax=Phycicoccus endophyticus TaxID=1690220 RepID=A0A7G9R367_9MICO|nr:SAF domain-containing protein [Phycicoccus endophyticus]NHI19781.1 hypothetical protein [Phycicoccus endophyticus]QNN50042.1 SAF domain-containing protein [Phycicoccus endophyticus]GGL28656.1 hypothetical protein GCM10012283_08570 [Phycicoccus endophyticus]